MGRIDHGDGCFEDRELVEFQDLDATPTISQDVGHGADSPHRCDGVGGDALGGRLRAVSKSDGVATTSGAQLFVVQRL